MESEADFDALESLFQLANRLREEDPNGLGDMLLKYADAWGKERKDYIDMIVRLKKGTD